MTAREWLEYGELSGNSFDALSNFWRAFNNLYAGQGHERNLISAFLYSHLNEQFSESLLNEHQNAVIYLTSSPIIDMRMNGRDTSQFIQEFNLATNAVQKIVALFMIIYQIRCNFEHGQKSPSNANDKALCDAVCPFIAAVIKNTINT